MSEGRTERATAGFIERVWRERWGGLIVSAGRTYLPSDVGGVTWRDLAGYPQGLVT